MSENDAGPLKPVPSFYTIVVEVTDSELASSTLSPLIKALGDDTLIPGLRVTGVSNRDEMTLLERFENGEPDDDDEDGHRVVMAM
ncbi:hypothetical protein LJR168_003924 [Pseudoxanthomonas sp. LjRoot168]|uniref:hypothetical protein n=1 Tax=unclassified Pseudoxanthomonas TaxID=2645906 RepID=UPI003ECD855E